MVKILPALGIMFCSFCLYELISSFLKKDEKDQRLFSSILALIAGIFLLLSAPVAIVIYLHDGRMRKVFYEQFQKDRAPYETMMERKYQEVCQEADSLRLSVIDERERSFMEGCERYKNGYYNGYTDCASHCIDEFIQDKDARRIFLSKCEKTALDYCKQLDDCI